MALGFDMGAPLFRPPVDQKRVDDWTRFLTAWGQKPVFAGRYFGSFNFDWVVGEIPFDLKSRIPGLFDELKYVLAFGGTGRQTSTRRVDLDGEPGWEFEVCYDQQGERIDGSPLPDRTILELGRQAGLKSCYAIMTPIDPEIVDLELPTSRALYVFLNVEPWTKLHPKFWQGWAEAVTSFTIDLGFSKPEIVQPFRPALYCAMTGNGPRLAAVRDVFAKHKVPACYAVATPWNPDGAVFPSWADAQAATDADVQAQWPRFGNLWQYYVGDVPVVVWQYRINIHLFLHVGFIPADGRFEIDLTATSERGRPVTDHMLKINW